MKKSYMILLLVSSLLLSAAAHFFFIKEWLEGRFMIGPNDGLSQMVPFKKFIYDQYTEGNFFYSWEFGLGGGFYSQLSYYFSTSLVFLVTVGIVFLLETMKAIEHPDLIFWADTTLFVSIARLSGIILAATFAFRYMGARLMPAFTGAAIYGLCVMYMRHVIFWEFFSDAMLWLPLIILGTEKIIREGKPGWFIAAWSLSFFDNFYFSYIHLIFLFIYIAFRWLIPLTEQEQPRWKQFRLFFFSGLASFCIGAISFIPAAYGFFNNYRPPYEADIPLFHIQDNILYASKYVILPSILLLFLFIRPLYKVRPFKFFAWLSLFLIVLHFSPLAGSAFNGFSAPQYRWEYILSFTAGGAVAWGLQSLNKIRWKPLLWATGIATIIYVLMEQLMKEAVALDFHREWLLAVSFLLVAALLLFLYVWQKKAWLKLALQVSVLLSCLIVVHEYERLTMSEKFNVGTVSREFLQSPEYDGAEQRELIEKAKEAETDPFFRIDWMNGLRNNTPIVQDFNGTSLYSSIFNQELLFFYWHNLKIDMGRESVSRYATLGNRANLHSLLQTDYWMREKQKEENAPYGFSPFAETENYIMYKNDWPLPFIRTAQKVFYEEDLENASPLDREHAMLSGVVLKEKTGQSAPLTREENLINQAGLETKGAAYENNLLQVTEEKGGINIIPPPSASDEGDYYLAFYLKNKEGNGFALTVNDYRTTRKPGDSIYKTNVHSILVRVPKEEKIKLRVPKGTYELKDIELYEEDYEELRAAAAKKAPSPSFEWKNNRITIDYQNGTDEQYMVLPVPFEKGWHLKVNGKKQPIEQANYAFIGIPLQEGDNRIELVYYPPFFFFSVLLSILGLMGAFWLIRRSREQKTP